MGLADMENIKLGVTIKDSDAGDVSKFLNRILGISVEKQNLVILKCMWPMYSIHQKVYVRFS
jgi:hypothetical protein